MSMYFLQQKCLWKRWAQGIFNHFVISFYVAAKKLNEDRALNYPAALIKQCSLKNEVKYSYSADVYLVFHTKRYWNLVPGTEKIAEGQNDMEGFVLLT